MAQDTPLPPMPAPTPGMPAAPTAPTDKQAALEMATAEILRLVDGISQSFIQIGFWLKRVRDENLYEAHGHKTFGNYLGTEVERCRSYAFAAISVVERLPMDRATRLGFEKSRAFLGYVNATPPKETHEEIALLLVPVKRNGADLFLPPEEATIDEIWQAARSLRARQAGAAIPDSSAFLLKATPTLERLGISLTSDSTSVDFGPVPFARLREFVAAMKAAVGT